MPNTNHYLRDTVQVVPSQAGIELRFSVWSIELPREFVGEPNGKLSSFFRRELSTSELNTEQGDVQCLVSLLLHQGCLVPFNTKATYQLPEVKSLYISFCNEWYGRYYSHRLWEAMRGAEIPISIIRQWISRTYFLSRFAGVTASAASLSGPSPAIRRAFQKSAVEEYSHCKDYYFPPAELFFGNLGYRNQISPSASFVAFDQQMLHIANNDWLAHLFVALFQERTAKFREGANQLYTRIEEQLRISGLFDGWRTHISYDEEHSHEDDLDLLFNEDIDISYEQLQRSFDEASLTIDLLIDGLEEVLSLGEQKKNPRADLNDTTVRAHQLAGIACLSDISEYEFKANSASELATEICKLMASTQSGSAFLSNATFFIAHQIENLASHLTAGCLSYCTTQDEIINIGKALEISIRAGYGSDPRLDAHDKASRVTRNYLYEKSKSASDFAFAFLLLIKMTEEGRRSSGNKDEHLALDHVCVCFDSATNSLCSHVNVTHYLTEALTAIALIEYAYQVQINLRQVPRFAMGHNTALQGTLRDKAAPRP